MASSSVRTEGSKSRTLICVPTYNERDNIIGLLTSVLNLTDPSVHILVADDNSPDGTADAVQSHLGERVHLMRRPGKAGLGKAYISAMGWGIEKGYDIIVQMDADFSHRPEDLVAILARFTDPKVDVVVGSRYVAGGKTVNWGILRKIVSRGGSLYARTILGHPLTDWTGGFNAWRRPVLEKMKIKAIESAGYCFQIEMKYRALLCGFNVVEQPIVFEDRRVGQSKMSGAIFLEAFLRVWVLRATTRLRLES